MAGEWSGDCAWHGLGLCWLPLPPEVISVAVRWYLRYGRSYRDGEELPAERGVTVDHVTIYRWVQRSTSGVHRGCSPCRHVPVCGRRRHHLQLTSSAVCTRPNLGGLGGRASCHFPPFGCRTASSPAMSAGCGRREVGSVWDVLSVVWAEDLLAQLGQGVCEQPGDVGFGISRRSADLPLSHVAVEPHGQQVFARWGSSCRCAQTASMLRDVSSRVSSVA